MRLNLHTLYYNTLRRKSTLIINHSKPDYFIFYMV
nr:MAG TPA: hypothetical protein [Caudoviricetes sp.]DAK80270.1 MAG TPA: hypothetical protein [Caudoviricetes sp.]